HSGKLNPNLHHRSRSVCERIAETSVTDMDNPESTRCRAGHAAVWHAAVALCAGSLFASVVASAHDKGTLDPEPVPPLATPASPATPGNPLSAPKTTVAEPPARSIGFYSKGCLAGAAALPVSGETWQVMRLSRNRNWGHPALVEFIEELSERAAQKGWPGL